MDINLACCHKFETIKMPANTKFAGIFIRLYDPNQ